VRVARHSMVLLSLVVAACGGRNPSQDTAPRRERNYIRVTEIQESAHQGISNVYDLVVKSHPEWLRTVSTGAGGATPSVYLDTQQMGGVSALTSIPLNIVTSVRMMSASETRGELGIYNPAGAIVVSSR
jgi:hypothetical protein